MEDKDLDLSKELATLTNTFTTTGSISSSSSNSPFGISTFGSAGLGTNIPNHSLHVNGNYHYRDTAELTQSEQVSNLLSSIASVEAMLVSLKSSVMELTSRIDPVKHEKRTLKTKE
tara:strand:+ start:1052 stop:1399 length:348 start_codon:yes stop_codon:yes gene_type:complete